MEIAVRIAHFANHVYEWGAGLIIGSLLSKLNRLFFACDIPPKVRIPKTTKLYHQGLGVVIHANTRLGENVVIRQHVTIGTNGKQGQEGIAPNIGSNVMIGAGACILGKISIGNNVTIGANAVVLKNIPDGCLAVGVPAIIKEKTYD